MRREGVLLWEEGLFCFGRGGCFGVGGEGVWCWRSGCLVLEGGVLVWEVYIKCELTAVASL